MCAMARASSGLFRSAMQDLVREVHLSTSIPALTTALGQIQLKVTAWLIIWASQRP